MKSLLKVLACFCYCLNIEFWELYISWKKLFCCICTLWIFYSSLLLLFPVFHEGSVSLRWCSFHIPFVFYEHWFSCHLRALCLHQAMEISTYVLFVSSTMIHFELIFIRGDYWVEIQYFIFVLFLSVDVQMFRKTMFFLELFSHFYQD